MCSDLVSGLTMRFVLLAFGIVFSQIHVGTALGQDIEELIVLPAMPKEPLVVPNTPNVPVVVPGPPTMTVVVPVLSDYAFPRYRSDDVLTQRNDNNRTGMAHVADINQHTVGRFQQLGSFPVNGVVLSQPLYVHSAVVNNVRQPVLIVATSNNDVYAFSPFENRPQPLWHRPLGRPVVSKHPPSGSPPGTRAPNADNIDCAPNDLAAWQQWETLGGIENGLVGIESTPVIDAALGLIFISYKTFDGLQRLAALRINDGSVFKAVVVPAPDAHWHRLHRNRASLVLADGVVFVGFSSLCEGNRTRMHGSISAFDAATVEPVGRFQITTDTDGGGVWQGSTGLAADTRGNLYFTTGNRRLCGAVPDGETASADRPNLASSVIRVRTERRLARGSEPYHLDMEAADYFTPYRRVMEDCYDLDLSAAGVLLIPGTPYLGTGGKQGVFYVLDRADMGGYDYAGPAWNFDTVNSPRTRMTRHKDALDEPSRDQVHQKFQATEVRHTAGTNYMLDQWIQWPHIHGTPAFASFSNDEFMFLWGEKDKLKRFQWRNGKFNLPPREGIHVAPPYVDDAHNGMPGGMVSVNVDPSGNGLGVVFASVKICGEAGFPACSASQDFGVLHAYDPFTMAPLWDNTREPDRYWFAKLVPPTIANGRVFLATASGKVLIYGVP